VQQSRQPPHPALAKHAHEPQARRPSRARAVRAQRRHVEQCAGGNRLVCRPAHTEQPQQRGAAGRVDRGARGAPLPAARPL